jgi:hypothetical protein
MNFKGVHALWENLVNSLKISLGLIFIKVNLVVTLACNILEF